MVDVSSTLTTIGDDGVVVPLYLEVMDDVVPVSVVTVSVGSFDSGNGACPGGCCCSAATTTV